MTFDYRAARERVFESDLPPLLRLVLLAMIEHMPECRPSVALLASRVGVERKTIMRAVERLERRGALRVERRNGASNRYHLGGPVPPEGPVPSNGTASVPQEGPVPERDRSQNGHQPVPFHDGTGPISDETSPTGGTRSREADLKQRKREGRARDPDQRSNHREPDGGLPPSAREQANGSTGPSLRYEFAKDWKPKAHHREEGRMLGLTDAQIVARANDCRRKPIAKGFLNEDDHFSREMTWAARDAEKERYRERVGKFESPGSGRTR